MGQLAYSRFTRPVPGLGARHETGHWYWEVLADRQGGTEAFRALFGDESASYADAIEQHYGGEPPAG